MFTGSAFASDSIEPLPFQRARTISFTEGKQIPDTIQETTESQTELDLSLPMSLVSGPGDGKVFEV